jgi:hypothetical protein
MIKNVYVEDDLEELMDLEAIDGYEMGFMMGYLRAAI